MEIEDVIKEVKDRLPQDVFMKVSAYKHQPEEIPNTIDSVVEVIYDVLAEKVLKCETNVLSVSDVDDVFRGLFDMELYNDRADFHHAIYDRVKYYDFRFFFPEEFGNDEILDLNYMCFYRANDPECAKFNDFDWKHSMNILNDES